MPTARAEIDQETIQRLRWYHTMDLPGGNVTPGEFDLRPIVARLPIPARMDGMRCLDVGGRDGFYAFEMERRGAGEVVSIDIEDPADVDCAGSRPDDEAIRQELAAGNRAFEFARAVLGSSVQRRMVSVYDLERESIGRFDFAVIGTLLHHLRDPVLAMSRVRGVLDGRLLVNNSVVPGLTSWRRAPRAVPLMLDGVPFWWLPNPAGLRKMVEGAGFVVERTGGPYFLPYGPGFDLDTFRWFTRGGLLGLPSRTFARRGDLHAWVLARPRETR